MSAPLHLVGMLTYTNTDSISAAFLDSFSLVDKSFDISKSGSYHLSIQISNTGLAYCVLDLERNKYLAIENIRCNSALAATSLSVEAKKTFDENAVLKSKFKSVSAAYINNQATLVPSTIFDEKRAGEFLQLNLDDKKTTDVLVTTTDSDREFGKDLLNELNSVNLYYFSEEAKSLLQSEYQNITIMHHSSILIRSALLRYKNQHKKKLLIHFHKDSFEVMVIDNNQLKIYNSFNYQTKEDFVYYILFACEQLSLNPELIETEVFGELDKHSEYYSMLYTYIRNITISKRPGDFEYSYQFEDLPGHYYYNLFSQYLCV